MAQTATLPRRLHHTAYVTRDQEKTRRFYEEVIGLPLLATWCESDELFGKVRTYVHTFYGIGDGGALAFFQFADPKDQEEFGPSMPATPFHHIALVCGRQVPGRYRGAHCTGGNRATRHLRAGARVLPLGVRHRSEWPDPGIYPRSSGCGERSRAPGVRMLTRN